MVEHGQSVIVLEARDRVGGRAWTEEFPGGFVDHGGQWIGPAETAEWVEIPVMGIIELDAAGRMTLMRDYVDSRLAL